MERRLWPVLLAGALGFGAIEASQIFVGEGLQGTPLGLGQLLPIVVTWLWLAALVPIVFWWAGRYPLHTGRGPRVIPHLFGAAAFAGLHLGGSALLQSIGVGAPFFAALSFQLEYYLALDMLVYAAIVGGHLALVYYRQAVERDRAAARLEASLSEARLEALRAQLNPHFLFNALNTISTLALKGDGSAVAETVGRLGDLLRASTDRAGTQEIPLADELQLLDHYLAIQQARFSDRLDVRQDIDPATLDALVPFLILQPLVENAVEHGVSAAGSAGTVTIQSRQENGKISLEVTDTGPGFGPGASRPGGVGLANTEARLAALYGDAGALHVSAMGPGGGGRVRVQLPFRVAAPAKTEPTAGAQVDPSSSAKGATSGGAEAP